MTNISVLFDFKKKIITLTINDEVLTKKIEINPKTDFLFIEFPYKENSKYVFIWSSWYKRQEYFEIEEFTKIDKSIINKLPICMQDNYNPWSELFKCSYIPYPQYGTIQTNEVKLIYNKTNFKKINFETIGRDDSKLNWKN